MSIEPRHVWLSISANQRRVILDDLAALLSEMRHDFRTRDAAASLPQSGDLRSSVESPASVDQSGKFAPAIRVASTRR